MSYLSREDLEKISDRVIAQYKEIYIPKHRMCYRVDVTKLAAMLDYQIKYVHITPNSTILGQTSNGEMWTTIYNESMQPMLFLLDGKTILVEKHLLDSHKSVGRLHFTIAHELAHQLINREYAEIYGTQNRVF